MEKCIINCAITGSRITREQTPYIPLSPEEIIDSAVSAYRAGAAVVHIHVRDAHTLQGTQDIELFRKVSEGIRERCDVVQCLTTSGIPGRNLPENERLAPLELNPEIASIDCGSINFGPLVYVCEEQFLEKELRLLAERKIKPELELFDLGMAELCRRFIEKGLVPEPYYFGLVLGSPSGAPATVRALQTMLDSLPAECVWFATGIGKHSLKVAMLSLVMGGHIRVGLEDTIYYSQGVLAESNAQLVERCVRIAGEYGREIATPDEARKILGIPPR